MREIKFRAWEKDQKLMSEPFALFDRVQFISFKFSFPSGVNPHSFEIMQFTGLKDKNGKEIFEGDIVRTPDGIGEVGYQVAMCSFLVGFPKLKNQTIPIWAAKNGLWEQGEVIGNIHQNPDLLK